MMKSYKHNSVAITLAFILLAVAFSASNGRAADRVVPVDYPSIQAAVDSAEPGDSVIVEDGVYKENILIKLPLVLRSRNGSERSVIEPLDSTLDIIRVENVQGVTISGFTLSGSTAIGLHILSSSAAKVFQNTITSNYYGLHLERTSDSLIKENRLNLNEQGLNLFFSDGNKIEANEVNSNTNSGILLHSSNNNELLENVASRNTWNGITISSSNGNIVTKNSILKNTYAIVVSESTGNSISANTTMPRLYYILPVALIYLAILLYILERKAFILYYKIKYREEAS